MRQFLTAKLALSIGRGQRCEDGWSQIVTAETGGPEIPNPHGEVGFRARTRRPPLSNLPLYVSSCLPIGSVRMRFPVAAKMALINAGAKGGTPGSPTPLGGVSASTGTI